VPVFFDAQDLQALWQQHTVASHDPYEHLQACPSHLGKGQRVQIQLRDGLSLLMHDYEFEKPVIVKGSGDHAASIEFGFQIEGRCLFGDGRIRQPGQNFHCITGSLKVEGESAACIERPAGERILQVDILLTSPESLWGAFVSQLDWLPPDIRRLMEWVVGTANSPPDLELRHFCKQLAQRYPCGFGTITPLMQIALQQLINCPYRGSTRQLYLEGKALELIALRLEQLKEQILTLEPRTQLPSGLQREDIERIYLAREILIENLRNPPSLLVLAHEVGLNDYKLKRGFRHLFDTTVFGYLQQYRLEQAQYLLSVQGMKVGNVARTVGYASRSSFIAAFRKKYGVPPTAYLKQK
jgi:AraC-like DNA-binding protein